MTIELEFNRSQALALDAENKTLMEEIKRLRAALRDILDDSEPLKEGSEFYIVHRTSIKVARAALGQSWDNQSGA